MPAPEPPPTLDYAPRIARPLWVRVGLWGIPSRFVAFTYLGVSLVATVVVSVLWSLLGLLLLLAALWYWLAIRWVDRNDRWHD
jgi:hypothetical protein